MQDMYILLQKLSDEKEESEMVACQLESEENEEEDKMVTIAVTIEEQLLRRLEASLHLEEEGLHLNREKRETGELHFFSQMDHMG